jgi:hypothetical protein
MIIRKVLTAAVLATGIAALAGPAFAGTMPMSSIMGTIDVSGGSAGITTSGGVTTINFTNPANIFSVSGSFDELQTGSTSTVPVCANCVALGTPFASNQSLPFSLFTGTNPNNGDTVGLSVISAHFAPGADGAYDVSGMGWVSLTNFSTTEGSYSMTIPSSGQNASVDIYSSVPEPGTLALFGAGLLGFAFFVGRRRRTTKPLA